MVVAPSRCRARAAALLSLVGAARAAQWPVHSWATLPVFFHSSVMNSLVPSDADLAIMARYPAVTLEKWQGCNSTGCYPGPCAAPAPTQAEATLATARKLKALRPSIAVATWTDSLRIYSNRSLNPSATNEDDQFCVNNQESVFLETHADEFLLRNETGGLALEGYAHLHVYDHRRASVRDFWRDACLNMTATGLIDGCGADASQQVGSYIIGLAPDVEAAWTTAHVQVVADTTSAVAAAGGGFVLGKLVQQLGVSVNAVLQEGCTASNATVITLLNATARARADKTRYIYECHSNGSESDMAAFLIGAGLDHYFGFGAWYSRSGGFAPSWKPEFEKPLGEPLADATYDAATSTWTRSFASGTKVTFNAVSAVGSIAWAT